MENCNSKLLCSCVVNKNIYMKLNGFVINIGTINIMPPK